jgi:hypothetical protein
LIEFAVRGTTSICPWGDPLPGKPYGGADDGLRNGWPPAR